MTCLHGSGRELGHAVVERAVERAAGVSDTAPLPVGPPVHVLVVHTGRSANLRWSADGAARRERFHSGEALINPAGWASRPRWQEDVELLLLGLEPAWLEQMAAEDGRRGRFELAPRFHFTDPLLTKLMERLASEYARPGPADSLYAQSLVQAAAAVVVRRASAGRGTAERDGAMPSRRLAQVMDYIHANLAERMALAELAAVAGVSTSHFTRLFRASTGQSPHQFVLQQRLERARRALLHTERPIANIATEAGFADQSHLTRMMRRHGGVTPQMLRESGD
ncbi:AraC family transcriptional regulator [Streptomyces sp. CMB-StM0423]|uniref:AraC family transcriptional regulator n=1 Tax=Streptomyces sp. CMB-StM0423 TaxID=2059884 RepID=UPI001F1F2F25|nr:AraC family transcriptional regulator [Streptomyces sp. CMB-StM0423]